MMRSRWLSPEGDPLKAAYSRSDHGAQYVSLLLGKTMRKGGIRSSVGSISSPWDNAATESLMGVIKSECMHARIFENREQATLALFEYIEHIYNRLKVHSALGWLSPVEFEAANKPKDRSSAA